MRELDSRFNSLHEAFFSLAAERPDSTVYRQKILNGAEWNWGQRDYSAVVRRVKSLSAWFKAKGLTLGDCVAIIANTRPEWLEVV